MSSFPKHLMVAIVLFVIAALVGGGLWFWTGSQLSDSLEEKRQLEMKIKSISGRGIFPNSQHLEQIEASTKEIKVLTDPVEESIRNTSKLFESVRGTANDDGSFSGLPANEWKRILAEKRDAAIQLAEQNNVILPEVFYLGFERYRKLSPSENATYHLGIQLLAINELLGLAFQSGVVEFLEMNRVHAEDTGATPNTEGLAAELAQGPEDWYTIYPLEIKYSGLANSVSRLTNGISASPYYFIVRSIDVENEKTSVPRKSEVTAQATGEGALKNIIPIVGQENIKVTMRVDLILWRLNEKPVVDAEKEKKK